MLVGAHALAPETAGVGAKGAIIGVGTSASLPLLYKKDKEYVVMPHPDPEESGRMSVIIVDEFAGGLMVRGQRSDGLHQAVEAKENVPIKEETQSVATVTIQNFFKLF